MAVLEVVEDVRPSSLTFGRCVLLVVVAWAACYVVKALYNISPLHPLSKIPGPRLAAATYWPEFYHDVWLGGRYTHAIKDMHAKYGPVVRISPDELHCSDAKFADEIYATGGRKRDKPQHEVNGANISGTPSEFGIKDHDLHRIRRRPVAKFFSTTMINQLEEEVHKLVNQLCDKLLGHAGSRSPVDVTMAYSCFTTDAISAYCFGESWGLMNRNTWTPNFRQATLALLKPMPLFRFYPILGRLSSILGKFMIPYANEETALFLKTIKYTIPGLLSEAETAVNAGIQFSRPTIFATLLRSEGPADKTQKSQWLKAEAAGVLGAGTETAAWALSVITYHLLDQPKLLERLRAELVANDLDPASLPTWTVLERLPYLNAVIHEGLRLSYGVSARTARAATDEILIYRGEFRQKSIVYQIPKGYGIGMSAAVSHHDETVFPQSNSFIPERWLNKDGARVKDPEIGFLAFSKGSRACLGKNLGLCELHLALAALALRVLPQMKLYETTVQDVEYDHDVVVAAPVSTSQGVRVMVDLDESLWTKG